MQKWALSVVGEWYFRYEHVFHAINMPWETTFNQIVKTMATCTSMCCAYQLALVRLHSLGCVVLCSIVSCIRNRFQHRFSRNIIAKWYHWTEWSSPEVTSRPFFFSFLYINARYSLDNLSWNKSIRIEWNHSGKEWSNKECIGFNALTCMLWLYTQRSKRSLLVLRCMLYCTVLCNFRLSNAPIIFQNQFVTQMCLPHAHPSPTAVPFLFAKITSIKNSEAHEASHTLCKLCSIAKWALWWNLFNHSLMMMSRYSI